MSNLQTIFRRFQMSHRQSSGFTLLEVLIAGGVLFVVASAVVGLSNSIIQGTGHNADRTQANRWASEGLELVNKIRTDSVLAGGTQVASDEKIWFAPAVGWQEYGWYELRETNLNGVTAWTLQKVTDTVHLALNQIPSMVQAPLTSQGITAYRLICVEAYGAVDQSDNDSYGLCNSKNTSGTSRATDGDRTNVTACQTDDSYCAATKSSLNQNRTVNGLDRLIPAGNAIKVRSIISWSDRTSFQTAELATVLTNWKGSEQN